VNLLFAKNKESHATSAIDMEIVTGTEKLAQFVPDGADAKLIAKATKAIKTIKCPETYEAKVFSTTELKNFNTPGNVYDANSAAKAERERALNEMKAREINDLKLRVQRLREWMAAQLLNAGKIEGSQDEGSSAEGWGIEGFRN
jgi:hypothetical protein